MSEIPDVIGGATVATVWGNLVKDRTVMRYANTAARDASIPVPVDGDVAWLAASNDLTIYTGGVWLVYVSTASGDQRYLELDGSNSMTGDMNVGGNFALNIAGDITVVQDADTRVFGTLAGGAATLSIKVASPVTGGFSTVPPPFRPSVGSLYWAVPAFTSGFAPKQDKYATFKLGSDGVLEALVEPSGAVAGDLYLCNVSYAVDVRGQ